MNLEINSITDVLNYIDYGLIDNNFNDNYLIYMRMMHNFVLDGGEINSEFQIEILQQINLIIVKLFNYKNAELKNEYLKLRQMVLQSVENIEEYSYSFSYI